MHGLLHVVHHDLVRVEQHRVLALLIGAHGEDDGVRGQPFLLQEFVLRLGDADHRVPLGGLAGVVAQDDLAGDHVLHVRLEALQGGAGHVIDAQLLNVEQGGDGPGLHVALHPRPIDAQADGAALAAAVVEEILQGHGGLGAGAHVGDQGSVQHGDKVVDVGVHQHDEGGAIGDVPLLPLPQIASGPLQPGHIGKAHIGRHGVHKAVIRRIGSRLPQVQVHLRGVDDGAVPHALEGLFHGGHHVLHGQQRPHVLFAQ